jgi:hypothetical protein
MGYQGVIGSTEDSDEDLGLANLTGVSINHWHSLASVINEQLLASTMFLTHDHIDLACPYTVMLAVPTVLEAFGVAEAILLPEQGQGDAGAAQFGMSPSPVRHWALITSGLSG